MIERKRRRFRRIICLSLPCIITATRYTVRLRNKHDGRGMPARIAMRIRIHTQQVYQLDVQAGFFLRFAHCGLLHRFPDIHETTWQRPAQWFVPAFDQHDPAWLIEQLDDKINGQQRCFRFRHAFVLSVQRKHGERMQLAQA